MFGIEHTGQTKQHTLDAGEHTVFRTELEGQGHTLPNYVQREFEKFLKCCPVC
jgi:hypothetical protein